MPDDNKQHISDFLLKFQAEGAAEASKATVKFTKSIDELKKSSNSLLAPMKKLAGLVGGGLGFEKSISFIDDYYKSMIALSAQMVKYGVGAKALEKQINSLSSSMKLTRMETIGLMSSFEKMFPLASANSFEKIMKNITNVVGANINQAKEYMGILGQVSNIMPEMQKSMDRLNKADKERLRSLSVLALIEGDMNLETSKSLSNIINQNKQISDSDSEHIKKWKDFVGSMQEIRTHFEKIAMVLGEAFMPLIKSISKYMTENKDTIVKWVGIIGKVSSVLVPVVLAFKAINGFSGGIAKSIGAFSGAGAISKTLGGKKGGLGGKQCVPVCGTGGAGGMGSIGGIGGGKSRNKFIRRGRVAMKKFGRTGAGKVLGKGVGTLKVVGQVLGKGMAMTAGAMIGREVGGAVGSQLGSKKTGQYAGAIGGGAAAGLSVAGPVGAAIGAGVGALYQGVLHLNEWLDTEDPLVVEQRNELMKIANNTKSIKEKMRSGAITKEQGQSRLDVNKARKDILTLPDQIKSLAKDIRDLKSGKDVLKTGMSIEDQLAKFQKAKHRTQDNLRSARETVKGGGVASADKKANETKARIVKAAKAEAERQKLIILQNKRYERQKKLTSAIIGDLTAEVNLMLLTNKISATALDSTITKARIELEEEKKLSDFRVKAAEKELKGARERIRLGTSTEADIQLVKQSTITIRKENAHIKELAVQQLSLWKKRSAVLETSKSLAAGTASIMETQMGILDQMGMGIGAPAEMRYQLMQQIGKQIIVVDKQIAVAKKAQASGEGTYADTQKEILTREQERLGLIQKQFSVSKALREGWVDALSAMTVASGRITKIMITKQSNLATMLSKGGVTSNVSGKMGRGGGTTASRFGINMGGGLGWSGGNNAGFQTDYGPDVRRVREMNENIMRGNIGGASGIATSQGTIMGNRAMSGSGTAFLSGPGVAAATAPGASGIKNIPGRNVGAGGGWSKGNSQNGVTVLNLNVEVHNRAELDKALADMAKKIYPK